MTEEFLTKEALLAWLDQCRRQRLLVAPQQEGDLLLFSPVQDTSKIVLDYINTRLSPKEWFLPKSDAILKIEGLNPAEWTVKPGDEIEEKIIFGMRPCDSWGIKILDKPYLAAPADNRYLERRAKTITIGLACVKAASSCFCTSMGTYPDDSRHNDIFLAPASGGYIVRGITDKGKELLSLAKLEEQNAESGRTVIVSEAKQSPELPPAIPHVPAKGVEKAFRNNFDSNYWDRLADRCIHCNICSYVCPNCYCFDMRDLSIHGSAGKWERVRTWESCQSPAFTRLAGGHNPRSTKGSRLRQRFAHKLLYFHDEYGDYLCSGCGRCVTACPVNIDIREIIHDLQEMEVSAAMKGENTV